VVRKALGLTQADLALAAGVGLRFVVELEAGKPTVRLELVLRVIDALGGTLQLGDLAMPISQGEGRQGSGSQGRFLFRRACPCRRSRLPMRYADPFSPDCCLRGSSGNGLPSSARSPNRTTSVCWRRSGVTVRAL